MLCDFYLSDYILKLQLNLSIRQEVWHAPEMEQPAPEGYRPRDNCWTHLRHAHHTPLYIRAAQQSPRPLRSQPRNGAGGRSSLTLTRAALTNYRTNMKWLTSVLTILCTLYTVNAAEIRMREELQALAEQIEILKTLHLTDVTRLKREVEELK